MRHPRLLRARADRSRPRAPPHNIRLKMLAARNSDRGVVVTVTRPARIAWQIAAGSGVASTIE